MSENHAPIRITRRRTPGWKTPLCTCGCGQPAIYVGRPTKWGNPFSAMECGERYPSLTAEQVAVIDQHGKTLSAGGDSTMAGKMADDRRPR